MKTIINYFFLLFILFLSSCDNTTEFTSDSSSNLIPFNINNEWNYDIIEYGFNPEDSSITLHDSTSEVMKLTYDTVASYKGYWIENLPFWVPLWGSPLFYYKEDGLYCAEVQMIVPPVPPTERRLLLYPTNVGNINLFENYTIFTASKNENVKVYSKYYTCLRYEVKYSDELVGVIWIAPGIGIVKCWEKLGYVTRNCFLNSFDLH